ncbi:MAG: glycoside hydrolase family 13 protein, partial [Oscillospiraceae bacterium]
GVFRCDDYFGGDLEGIREKLPYLEGLGVTALYLNPIFEAHSNHRYNTANYEKIDPLLGTEADFRALCADARAHGIAVVLDGVFSHTGSDSVYMNREGRYGERVGAARDPESPYRAWFSFEHYPDRYKCWWNFATLPEVRETEPSYLEYIAGQGGIIDRWMEAGAAGWRLDVADELPDAALDVLCAAMRRNHPDAPIIGEVWEDASNKSAYGTRRRYLLGRQLSSVMNYPLTDAILAFVRDGDAYSLFYTLLTQMENYPPPVLHALMNPLSTHDIERAVTRLAAPSCAGAGRDWQQAHNTLSPAQLARGKTLLRLASVLQYTLPGCPCLYYGDEAGMFGYKDPFNRGCYPWGGEDAALVDFFRTLGGLRRRVSCLTDGSFSLVRMSDEVFAFVRRNAKESLYVAVNRSAVPCTPPLPPELRPDEGEL